MEAVESSPVDDWPDMNESEQKTRPQGKFYANEKGTKAWSACNFEGVEGSVKKFIGEGVCAGEGECMVTSG